MIPDPLFIVGTERSGSNLLRMILNAHSRITVPHPPHIVRYFAPIEGRYGNLSNVRAFRALVRDVLRLVRAHIYPWEVILDEEETIALAPERSVLGVYAAVYEQHRRASGKARWGCKSTFMIEHVTDVLRLFPAAKIILMVRDPRDVAASSRRSVFSTFHPYFTARLWQQNQALGARLLDTLPARTIHLLRYEELVASPEKTLRALSEFLDEPFEPAMLAFQNSSEAHKSASLSESWARTDQPITDSSVSSWRRELSDEEAMLVEAIARDLMKRFGYAPAHDLNRPDVMTTRRRAEIFARDLLYRARVERRSLTHDRNVWLRWRRDALARLIQLRRRLPLGGRDG